MLLMAETLPDAAEGAGERQARTFAHVRKTADYVRACFGARAIAECIALIALARGSTRVKLRLRTCAVSASARVVTMFLFSIAESRLLCRASALVNQCPVVRMFVRMFVRIFEYLFEYPFECSLRFRTKSFFGRLPIAV